MYILQSSIDNKKLEVDESMINSSVLLKNLCELTLITKPIQVPCSSESLKQYVQIIQNKNEFFFGMSDQELAKICIELCILDSDVVLDSIAEEILNRIQKFNCYQMAEYFGLEDDFSVDQRRIIDDWSQIEYLISMDTDEIKFPFVGTNFSSMKNKFYTPLNALLARIIQLSTGKTSFELSKINKTMKNESDRYPIKVDHFQVGQRWLLNIVQKVFRFEDKKYFDHIRRRNITVKSSVTIFCYGDPTFNMGTVQCPSLNFVIPTNSNPLVLYMQRGEQAIYRFNVLECPFLSIKYEFMSISVDFDKVYEHLVAKDIKKEIEIYSSAAFNFFELGEDLRMYKKPYKLKFHEIRLHISLENKMSSNFIEFVQKYMSDDGIIYCSRNIFDIPHSINYTTDNRRNDRYAYAVPEFKKWF